jgi:hypothetical protein
MMGRGNTIKVVLFMALCVLLVLAACASSPVRVLPVVGAPIYEPTDPSTVLILRAEPQRPFETLGQVVVEPEKQMSEAQVEQMLREAAAGMGANAVFIQADMTMEAGEIRQQFSGGQIVTAIAIRFKD